MGDRGGSEGRPSRYHDQPICRRWNERAALQGGLSCRCSCELVLDPGEIALVAGELALVAGELVLEPGEFALEPERASPPVRDRDAALDRARERVPRQRRARRRPSRRRDFAPTRELQTTGTQGTYRKGFSFQSPGSVLGSDLELCTEDSLFGWAPSKTCRGDLAVAHFGEIDSKAVRGICERLENLPSSCRLRYEKRTDYTIGINHETRQNLYAYGR